MRLRRAIGEYVVGGIETNLALHRRLLGNRDFLDGHYDVHWLERFMAAERAAG